MLRQVAVPQQTFVRFAWNTRLMGILVKMLISVRDDLSAHITRNLSTRRADHLVAPAFLGVWLFAFGVRASSEKGFGHGIFDSMQFIEFAFRLYLGAGLWDVLLYLSEAIQLVIGATHETLALSACDSSTFLVQASEQFLVGVINDHGKWAPWAALQAFYGCFVELGLLSDPVIQFERCFGQEAFDFPFRQRRAASILMPADDDKPVLLQVHIDMLLGAFLAVRVIARTMEHVGLIISNFRGMKKYPRVCRP